MALSHQLPLLIADKIPKDDHAWNHYLLLLKICKIANSAVCTPDTIAYLSILIEEKLRSFNTVYPHAKILPKHHYMVHYPSQIQRLGPLIHSWTMRQESKLSFVKRISRQSNFKNICKTVAKKHLFWMCYQLNTDQHILAPLITLSTRFKSSVLLSEDECVRKEFLRLIPSIDLESEIKHVEWLKVQSSLLRKETFILLEYDTATPLFGLIMDILCFDAIFLLYVQKYVSEVFDSHFNAFIIKSTGEFIVLNLSNISDHRPVIVKSNFVPSNKEMYALLLYYY